MLIHKIFRKAFHYIYSNLNHVGYAKFIGVNMGNNVHIYGNPLGMFSTEPWIITLGNNVHITREVLFINPAANRITPTGKGSKTALHP